MTVSTQLHLKQGHSLLLAPQVIQSIRLLQMTAVELEAFINAELEKNPLLEKADNRQSTQDTPSFQPDRSAQTETTDPLLLVAAQTSLRDMLHEQIVFAFRDERERLIAFALSEQIDDAGYFTGNLAETARQFNTEHKHVQTVFSRMQTFEPAGIFARNLSECLALQLKHQGHFTATMDVLLQNLPALARYDYAALAKICKAGEDEIIELHEKIRRLDPKPAAGWSTGTAEAVVPDAFVARRSDGSLHVTLNNDVLPTVLMNNTYTLNTCANQAERDFFTGCRRHASWLLRALDQRAQTLLKIIGAVVTYQEAFLRDGSSALKPLKQATIAATINMHESTVSRVVAHRYIATPRGVFALRRFFSGELGKNSTSDTHAANAVQSRIRQLIAAETADNILSDDTILQQLKADGVDIARRTIAKYREMMHIPSSAVRRRLRKHNKQHV